MFVIGILVTWQPARYQTVFEHSDIGTRRRPVLLRRLLKRGTVSPRHAQEGSSTTKSRAVVWCCEAFNIWVTTEGISAVIMVSGTQFFSSCEYRVTKEYSDLRLKQTFGIPAKVNRRFMGAARYRLIGTNSIDYSISWNANTASCPAGQDITLSFMETQSFKRATNPMMSQSKPVRLPQTTGWF
jgi:hypothetical protein